LLQRTLAALIASALLSMTGTPTASANGGTPSYYPFGPVANIDLSTVTSGGWKLCFSETWTQVGTSVNQIKNDCAGSYLLITGREIGSTNLDLLAAAPFDSVFTETVRNTPHLDNGSWWYFTTGISMGFAFRETIEQSSCDVANNDVGELSLCWHLDPAPDPADSLMDNGYQMNGIRLNSGDGYLREIYVASGGSTISNKAPNLLSAQPRSGMTKASYLWYRCTLPGSESTNLPRDCRSTGVTSKIYRVTLQDKRAGYLRVFVRSGQDRYYSETWSLSPIN
jgi:hypothetical protein